MTLYHFTAQRFMINIKREGLTKGRMLKSTSPLSFLYGKQWLTQNSSFDQEWAVGTGKLPYKRNEVRIEVEIPSDSEHNLMSWNRAKFLTPEVAEVLSCRGDPENWFIYDGNISPYWLKDYLTPTQGNEE